MDGKRQSEPWQFVLYIAGDTAKSDFAITNLRRICDSYVGDNYDIQIVDLLENPEIARLHQILAVPTVVRTYPLPEKRVIGDLSYVEQVVNGLELPAKAPEKLA